MLKMEKLTGKRSWRSIQRTARSASLDGLAEEDRGGPRPSNKGNPTATYESLGVDTGQRRWMNGRCSDLTLHARLIIRHSTTVLLTKQELTICRILSLR